MQGHPADGVMMGKDAEINATKEAALILVGKCVINYQSIEQILKQLIPRASLEGAMDDMVAIQAKQRIKSEFSMLGLLVGRFTREMMTNEPEPKESESGGKEHVFRFQFFVEFTTEEAGPGSNFAA